MPITVRVVPLGNTPTSIPGLHLGDCIKVMQRMAPNSVDAIVTDPPYGLEFMGKEWDRLGAGQIGKPGIGDRPTDWVSQRGWNDRRCSKCGHLPHGDRHVSVLSPTLCMT